jgi:transcriptional regulator of acetoin/glycerol metabolism
VHFVEQLSRLIAEQTDMLWDAVQAFLDSGSDPDELASALGISRATLYRRLKERSESFSQE